MSSKALSDLVSDWGGFEILIAQLHETGNVCVERDVTLPGRSGAPRKLDVVVRHTVDLYQHLIVVECKYHNDRIERLHVDALATTLREVGASRGVIFSTKGFQKGAAQQARHENIALFKLREPTDEEWGLPGRHVDVWLQFVSTGMGEFQLPGATLKTPSIPRSIALNIEFGADGPVSKTPIKASDVPDATLEELIQRLVKTVMAQAYKPQRYNFDGKFDGVMKQVVRINYQPTAEAEISVGDAIVIVPRITFLLGIKVSQSRLQIDRRNAFAFALAVEDCVNKTVTTASRRPGEEVTTLRPVAAAPSEGPVFENGSILTATAKGFEPFSEFAGLQPGPDEQKLRLQT